MAFYWYTFCMLLSPCGKNTPNPGIQIPNAIMGYVGGFPPVYGRIRDIVCAIFGVSPLFVINKGSGYKHRIIYISPKVDRLAEGNVFLMAECHDKHPLCEEGRKTNSIAMAWAGKPPGSIVMLEWGENRIDKGEGPLREFEEKYLAERFKIPSSLTKAIYGWDDPTSASSQGVRFAIDARKLRLKAEQGFPVDPRELMEKSRGLLTMVHDPWKAFKERTKTMVKALTFAINKQDKLADLTVKKGSQKIKGNILLIAGIFHLEPHPRASVDKELDLQALYDLIHNHSVIVVSPHKITSSTVL